jgi:hypothetical protein
MTGGWDADLSAAAAYQEVTLAELRRAFDQVDFDLRDLLEREIGVENGIDETAAEVEVLRGELVALGATPTPATSPAPGSEELEPSRAPHRSRYEVPLVPALEDFDLIVSLANARLAQPGVDLGRDPLLQVLPNGQISQSLKEYSDTYGDTSWSRTDWTADEAASRGLADTPARTPRSSRCVRRRSAGSARASSGEAHEREGQCSPSSA